MTNPRELVERRNISCCACEDRPQHPNDPCAVCGKPSEAASEITRLCDFITALEDGNMTFLCDQLDRAKEENTRLRGLLPDWRPIETAPKDGTIFDAWADFECPSHKSGARYVSARYVPEKGRWEDSCGNIIQYLQLPDEDGWWQARYLTHWMPLPPPPQ